MIEVIALGMAALALILGFMGTGGVSDLKRKLEDRLLFIEPRICLLYTSPSPRDQRGARMPSSA